MDLVDALLVESLAESQQLLNTLPLAVWQQALLETVAEGQNDVILDCIGINMSSIVFVFCICYTCTQVLQLY